MKKFLHLKIHPALIISSVLFWFVLYFLVYLLLMLYWIHKVFFTVDKNVRADEAVVTIAGYHATKVIYQCRMHQYIPNLKPFAKR